MKAVRISTFEWNYLKDDGSYLLDEHVFDCFGNFSERSELVVYSNDFSCNFVDLEGKILLKTNIKFGRYSFIEGFTKICINNNYYYIDKECNFYNKDKVSFKELYVLYPNKRTELIKFISEYTFYNIEEYFL